MMFYENDSSSIAVATAPARSGGNVLFVAAIRHDAS
jgi:hypothetical protein